MNTTGWQTTRRAAFFLCAALFLFTGCKDLFHPEGPPPEAPSGATATANSSSSIEISWNYVSKAKGYHVYRAESINGPFSFRKTSYSTYYVDDYLQPNTTYYYKVCAYDKKDRDSPWSKVVSAKTYLGVPLNVSVVALSSDSLKISWDLLPGASGYRIYRANSSYGTESFLATTSDTEYTATGLSPNTDYYYKVSAYDSNNNEGSKSEFKSATTSPSMSSVSVTAKSSNSIDISWGYVSGASGYYIYRSTSSGGPYTKLATGASTTASYTDTGLLPGIPYYYKVSAYNSNFVEGSQSNYGSATTHPETPSGVTAEALSSSSIEISWTAAAGAVGYYVYRNEYGTYTKLPTGAITTTSYTDTGRSPGSTYYYKVSAYNSSNGEGAQSSSVSATTKARYTVTFYPNGGTPTSAQTRSVDSGDSIGTDDMVSNPTKANYTFDRWNTQSDGSGTNFTAATPVTTNIQVYAQWTINQYTVTFNSNYGDSSILETRTVNHGASIGALPTPTRSGGYTFDGWNTTPNGDGDEFTTATEVTANVTVYANWIVPSSGISNITYSLVTGIAAWTLQSDGRYKSPIISHDATTKFRIRFDSTASASIVIQLRVSSESGYDWAFISELDNASATYQSGYSGSPISGETSVTVTIPVPDADSHFIDIGYSKDSSNAVGSDCAWFKVVPVAP
jgi:uncharacterized repeat protein (TIGR02543 family)